jgi:hypothetical protein
MPGPFALWTVMLGPPALWITEYFFRYAIVSWCCANPQGRWLFWAASALALGFAFFCVLLALRCWRRDAPLAATEDVSASPKRIRFMARVGLMTSCLFALLTIATFLPLLFVDPCVR